MRHRIRIVRDAGRVHAWAKYPWDKPYKVCPTGIGPYKVCPTGIDEKQGRDTDEQQQRCDTEQQERCQNTLQHSKTSRESAVRFDGVRR
jgi:hypothetical protein